MRKKFIVTLYLIFSLTTLYSKGKGSFIKLNFNYASVDYFEFRRQLPKGLCLGFGLYGDKFTHQINLSYANFKTNYQLFDLKISPLPSSKYYYKYNFTWLNLEYGLGYNVIKKEKHIVLFGINSILSKPISSKKTIKEIPSGITHTLELAQPNTYIFYGGVKAEYFYFPFNNLGFNIAICGGRNFNRTYTRSLFLQSSVGVTYKL